MIKASKIIHGCAAFAFFAAILLSILRGFVKIAAWQVIVVLVAGAAFSALAVWFYGFLKKHAEILTTSQINKIFWLVALFVLALQIICAFGLKSEPINDLGYIDSAAREFCRSWDKSDLYKNLPERHQVYFARYPNNHAILIIVSLIYYVTDTLFGKVPIMAPILVNTLGLNISFILMYFISKRIFSDKVTPLYTAVIGALFCVFYTYTPYFYTDSMSMTFVMGSVLLFLKGVSSDKTRSMVISLVLSSVLGVIGYKIKGSVIILPVAYLSYIIYMANKAELKRRFKEIGIIIVTSVLSIVIVSSAINAFGLASDKEENAYEFPLTHWVMMGLHDRGGYYDEDFWYTEKAGDYEEKSQADVDMIKERISDYGVFGVVKHLAKKIGYTWDDGTYFITRYLKHGDGNALRSFVTKSPIFYLYASAYQAMLLVMMFLSYAKGARQNKRDAITLVRIIIFGVFLFFLIWEARSRYLVNFTPLFIIAAVFGIKTLFEAHKRKRTQKTTISDTLA